MLVNTIEYLEAKKPENASNEESNPYAEFGQQIAIDENDLPF